MKRSVLHIVQVVTLAVLISLPSVASAVTCDSPIVIGPLPPALRVQAIQNALDNYDLYPQGDDYVVCFEMSPLAVSASILGEPFSIEPTADETRDVYVVGLKLSSSIFDPVAGELFRVENDGGGRVILKDFEFDDVSDGIALAGSGQTSVVSSAVYGSTQKDGSCISVESGNVTIEGVDVKSCGVGVDIEAPGAKVKNSKIWVNHIGVRIAQGILGTDIERSQVFGNDDGDPYNFKRDDGIRIEGGASHGLEMNQQSPDVEISVVLPDGYELAGRIEFYFTSSSYCGLTVNAYSQAACYVERDYLTNPIEITPDLIAAGGLEIEVEPVDWDKYLVAIYTHPVLGTAGISKKFNVNGGGVVAFVTTPYDIPTTGNIEDEASDGAGDGMGGDGEMLEGDASLAPTGGCAASLTGDSSSSGGLSVLMFALIACFVFAAWASKGSRRYHS